MFFIYCDNIIYLTFRCRKSQRARAIIAAQVTLSRFCSHPQVSFYEKKQYVYYYHLLLSFIITILYLLLTFIIIIIIIICRFIIFFYYYLSFIFSVHTSTGNTITLFFKNNINSINSLINIFYEITNKCLCISLFHKFNISF